MSSIPDALAALRRGRPVVLPTDTVYGIAALPCIPGAVRAVFEAKGRPEDKALPVLGASLRDLSHVVRVSPAAERLAGRFWPGPLTLVLPRAPGWTHDLGGDRRDTVAVRVPRSATALELLGASGPLAVSSANRSGRPPAATVAAARAALQPAVEVFLDGGRLQGSPSTVVDLTRRPTVLRTGTITEEEIVEALAASS